MEPNELTSAALEAYGVTESETVFIRHNENMTYCVDEAYLLRIHKPRTGFATDFFHSGIDTASLHEDELRFLEHLRTCGLQVQRPLRNREGRLVTVLPDGTPATMLKWLPGRPLEDADLTPEMGDMLGNMLGALHTASATFHAASQSAFRRYDYVLCERLNKLFAGYHEHGRLETPYFMQISGALRVIGEALRESAESHILVHSDLSCSNILVTERGLVPIDFSLLGYSTPMLDFGSLFCFIGEERCQEQIIRSYETAMGTTVDRWLIDCCVALQILLSIALHYEVWEGED